MAVKKKIDYETAAKRLEEIVAHLERNPATLEEAVNLYKEGKEMLEICQERLKAAEGEIKKFTEEGLKDMKVEEEAPWN